MEELTRMQQSIDQLTKRVDDHAFRLAIVENERKGLDDKLDALRELLELKLGIVQKSVDGWNKIGFWLLTTVGGVLIVSVLGVIIIRPGA
jgi:hypothetical protein